MKRKSIVILLILILIGSMFTIACSKDEEVNEQADIEVEEAEEVDNEVEEVQEVEEVEQENESDEDDGWIQGQYMWDAVSDTTVMSELLGLNFKAELADKIYYSKDGQVYFYVEDETTIVMGTVNIQDDGTGIWGDIYKLRAAYVNEFRDNGDIALQVITKDVSTDDVREAAMDITFNFQELTFSISEEVWQLEEYADSVEEFVSVAEHHLEEIMNEHNEFIESKD
ncbi:hypothetical protein RH915_10685 [Serpentinicella sp. ANB-PHB4]|uniref:hypothetical protein n=1 Tax=Serpentinicella sp. ANB-PHB4 TaxID=3074076 RepID=UPI002863C972|nr:hypothetical protein [Serpentinicella sp. ANB-PHB4]MDR5659955.1 hypothetical protein [Serpentinicella sp. ANB-PHB4]